MKTLILALLVLVVSQAAYADYNADMAVYNAKMNDYRAKVEDYNLQQKNIRARYAKGQPMSDQDAKELAEIQRGIVDGSIITNATAVEVLIMTKETRGEIEMPQRPALPPVKPISEAKKKDDYCLILSVGYRAASSYRNLGLPPMDALDYISGSLHEEELLNLVPCNI